MWSAVSDPPTSWSSTAERAPQHGLDDGRHAEWGRDELDETEDRATDRDLKLRDEEHHRQDEEQAEPVEPAIQCEGLTCEEIRVFTVFSALIPQVPGEGSDSDPVRSGSVVRSPISA